MSQVKSGTVDVTASSQVVSGNGTTWLSDGVEAGDAFIVQSEGIVYDIGSVDSNTQITLTANYAGSTASDVAYVIATDFTPNKGYPELQAGSLETASLFTRAMREIDEDIGQLPLASDLGDAAYEDVMTSLTDTTAGRLMPVGAFGLGSVTTNPGQRLDAYDWGTQVIGWISSSSPPADAPNTSGSVGFTLANGSTRGAQVIWQAQGRNTEMYYRARDNTYGDWVKVFHTGNILGTVSQSGGVPTGAVIERGSNANGEYVKFADGTMICSAKLTLSGGQANSWRQMWTFPASFSTAQNRSITVTPDLLGSDLSFSQRGQLSSMAARNTGTTNEFIDAYTSEGSSIDTSASDLPVSVTVVGRWW